LVAFAGFAMAQIMENFESLNMNLMEGGTNGSLTVVPNPAPDAINGSAYVVKFVRPFDGKPWSGFYGTLPTAVSFDTYRYVHVKVWKSRISPVKFKIEGGATGNIEIASKYPQTVVNGWEDIVFDFTKATGPYTKIVWMPEFEDPLTLTEDITMYFDDMIVNNDSTTMTVREQIINVDMSAAGLTAGQKVYIAGALGGIYGTWNEPGTNANNEMLDPNADGIYSITLNLPDGLVALKFFKGAGWNGGDNAPGGDRVLKVDGSMDVKYKFGTQGTVSVKQDDKVVMENFESLKMNLMEGGTNGSITVVPNPDKSGVELSDYVVKFVRPKDGQPWSGFYATLDKPVSFTTKKYVHVMVWKSRISPVKFKIEGGKTGNIEIASKYPQTVVNGWEDMVFDFSKADSAYSKIVFMPDFEDPLALTEDITMYYDDFVLNSDSTTAGPPSQVINVDMNGAGLTEGQQVFIAGALGGIYGTWNEPGTNLNNEMLDPNADGIYTINLSLADGLYAFKFFKGTGWNGGDSYTGGDRTYTFPRNANITYKWGAPTLDDINLIKDGHFNTDGGIAAPWATWSGNGGTAAIIDGICAMTPGAAGAQWQLQVNQTGNDNGWRTGNDSTFVLMFDAWADADRVFAIDFEDNAGNGYKRYGLSSDPDAVNGESEWQVNLTTTNTTFTRVTTMNAVKANTTFKLNIMPSLTAEKVYIDNIYLIYVPNLSKLGTAVSSIVVSSEGAANTIDVDKATLQMSAEILPANATLKNIAWTVSDTIATINGSGLLTASGNGPVTVTATSKDWEGVSGSFDITISNQTLAVKSNLVKNVKVYPNPAVNELIVSFPSANAKVAIYNSIGSKLKEVDVQGTQARFDVSSFAHGVYFVKLNNETVGKFVK
jgi:hypothetical protein